MRIGASSAWNRSVREFEDGRRRSPLRCPAHSCDGGVNGDAGEGGDEVGAYPRD